MAVSKHIVDLTRLALADHVLTFKERETIVKEALAEGISEPEINAFMDNMLAQRLKSLHKEELKDCPACGAQIPLISDQCLFCGHKLESQEGAPAQHVSVTGSAADIIRQENLKTVAEEQNLTNCPNCGAPFPLISNICTHCGHVLHARKDSDLNIKTLIDNISQSITKIQSAHKPTVFEMIAANWSKLLLLFSIALLVSSFAYPGGWGICAFVVAIPLIFLGVIKSQSDGYSPVELADYAYYSALNDRNMYIRLVQSVYGDNPEAKKYIAQLGDEIQKAERNRRSNRLIITIFAVIVFAMMLLPLVVKPSYEKYVDNNIDKNYTIFKTDEPTNK
ncbi:MAG: zinc ribbon domain-containing protein [Bacteroidales bacterium]|nr:zinc ribbon domain-containing protein [Bacteroidales bacterium]